MRRLTNALVVSVALVACKDKSTPTATETIPPVASGAASKPGSKKAAKKPPESSDCASKGGVCVARDEKEGCKETFYSHACADEGTDQPLCCLAPR